MQRYRRCARQNDAGGWGWSLWHTHTHRYAFAVDKFVQKFIMSNANGV